MKRVFVLLVMFFALVSCSSDDPNIEKKYVVETVEQKIADEEELLTREELILRLESAGLKLKTSQVKYTPKSLQKAFDKVKQPKEYFMVSTNDELFWVSRFNTIGQAKQVDNDFDDGFRFSNWHFAGQISVETTNLIVQALEANQKDD